MELIHSWHAYLGMAASTLKLILESVSVFCVALGLLAASGFVLSHFLPTGNLSPACPRCG
jgi:hypothetical protein